MRLTVSALLLALSWSVTPAQPITVLTPNGAEVFAIGDTMRVRWTTDGSVPMVMIEISLDDAESWYGVYTSGIDPESPYWGDFAWVIPDTVRAAQRKSSVVSQSCRIRVRNYIDQITEDQSDGVFRILLVHETPVAPDDPGSDCGCGSGAGVAFIPPLVLRFVRRKRRRTDRTV